MATIKSYTDISQSKKLAKILPLESADYFHAPYAGIVVTEPYKLNEDDETVITAYKGAIPCWSLAALLNIIQETIPYKMEYFGDKNVQLTCFLGDKPWELIISDFDNEVDACYEMILKLHELNLL